MKNIDKINKQLIDTIKKLNDKTAELKKIKTGRNYAEEAQQESEEKYLKLFDNMLDGFALHEIVLNNNNVPIDYIFIDINDAFENQTGLKREKIIGKNVTEVLPDIEHDPAGWIERYGKVALKGKSIRFENYSEQLKKWYSVLVYSPQKGYFATIFQDITERKQAEEKLNATNQQLIASEQQLRAANQQLTATEQQLRAANQQLIAHEKEILKRAHDLGERVKELDCLYGIAESIITKETIEEILQDTAKIIPPSWQYPKITRGKIRFNGKEYVSQAFKESKWKQSADIIVNGKVSGAIEVYYLEECPELDEGPFMKEERNLITGLAITIGKAIERMQAEEELKATNQQLIASEQQLRAANQQLTASEQQLRAANQQLIAHGKELRKSEYQLKETQEIAGLGSYVLDISSGIWKSSSILDNIFGLDKKYKKDISGWLQIIHPEDKTMVQDYFATNVLINHELFNKEYRIKRINDQQERWVHGMGKLEFNDDEDPIKMIGTIQDITERKQAEEKFKLLSLSVEQSTEGMAHADLNGNLIYINKAWCEMHGYKSSKNLLGKNLKIFHNKKQLENDIIPFNEEVKKNGTCSGEVGHITKEGKTFPTLMTSTLLEDAQGNPFAMVGIARDITERKRVEEKLISRNKELELFNEVTVDRELKMIELKKEINELLEKSDKKPKYKIII